jgi:hypothetical protein
MVKQGTHNPLSRGSIPRGPTKRKYTMKIYLAMAEMPDGNRIFERAYLTEVEAAQAAESMVKDVNDNTDMQVAPVVEDIELVLTKQDASMGELVDPGDLKSPA